MWQLAAYGLSQNKFSYKKEKHILVEIINSKFKLIQVMCQVLFNQIKYETTQLISGLRFGLW